MGAWTEAPGIFVDHAVSYNDRYYEASWVAPAIQACIAALLLLLLCLLELHTSSWPLLSRRLPSCAYFSYRQSANVEVAASPLQDTQPNRSIVGSSTWLLRHAGTATLNLHSKKRTKFTHAWLCSLLFSNSRSGKAQFPLLEVSLLISIWAWHYGVGGFNHFIKTRESVFNHFIKRWESVCMCVWI